MSTPEDGRRQAARPLRGDEGELFREFNSSFVRTVQGRTGAPRETVNDACAFAWQQFVRHQPDRDRNWRAWMVRTAEREAWRLHRAEADHLSLSIEEREGGPPSSWEPADERDQPAIRLRLREALEAFARLPERPRQIKALQIEGFSYEEIAQMRGLTYTRVNHLLLEANVALRERQGRAAASRVDASPSAVRLDELERHPPVWLRRAIGRRPGLAEDQGAMLAWRRAALSLDDYRRNYGRGLGDEPIGERPAEREAARAFDLARMSIERAVKARTRVRHRGLER